MTRRQRRLHLFLWPALALAMAAVIGAALYERARVADMAAAVEAAG